MGCGNNPEDTAANRSEEHSHNGKKHSHAPEEVHPQKTPGPNGGRLIMSIEPGFEFWVQEDRKVRLTFVDSDTKPVGVPEAAISLFCGDRRTPTTLTFVKTNNVLISDKALPEGAFLPVSLDIKVPPDSESIYEKFNIDYSICTRCRLVEYTCICGH